LAAARCPPPCPTVADDSAAARRSAVRPSLAEVSAAARRSAARPTLDEDSAAARFSQARPTLDEDSAAARCSAAPRLTLGVDLVAVGLVGARPRNRSGEKTTASRAAVRRGRHQVGSAAVRGFSTRHRTTECTREKTLVDASVCEWSRTKVEKWGGRLGTSNRRGAGAPRPPTSRRTGPADVPAPCASSSRSRLERASNPLGSMDAPKHSGCRFFDAGQQAARKSSRQQPAIKCAHRAETRKANSTQRAHTGRAGRRQGGSKCARERKGGQHAAPPRSFEAQDAPMRARPILRCKAATHTRLPSVINVAHTRPICWASALQSLTCRLPRGPP